MLRIIEGVMPTVYHPKARTGRPPYDDMAFFRSFLALNYFAIPRVALLIKTLKSDPSLRQLCGFKRVPVNSSFSIKQKFGGLLAEAEESYKILLNFYVKDTHVKSLSLN
jgi:hypothetical protein